MQMRLTTQMKAVEGGGEGVDGNSYCETSGTKRLRLIDDDPLEHYSRWTAEEEEEEEVEEVEEDAAVRSKVNWTGWRPH